MRFVLIALFLAVVAGCESHYDVDFSKAIEAEDFEWNGQMHVRRTSHGLFGMFGSGIDRVELGSEDGRSILIRDEGQSVRAYIEMEVTPTEPPTQSQPTDEMQPLEPNEPIEKEGS